MCPTLNLPDSTPSLPEYGRLTSLEGTVCIQRKKIWIEYLLRDTTIIIMLCTFKGCMYLILTQYGKIVTNDSRYTT